MIFNIGHTVTERGEATWLCRIAPHFILCPSGIQTPQRCPDHLQGANDSRPFSRMVGLLDRWASSFGVEVNFSKAAKSRQKKSSLVLLMCFTRAAKDSKNPALWSLCSISYLWNSSSWLRVPEVFGHVESYWFLWSGNSAAAASETRAQGLPITSEKKICTFKKFPHYLWKQRTLSKEKLLIP